MKNGLKSFGKSIISHINTKIMAEYSFISKEELKEHATDAKIQDNLNALKHVLTKNATTLLTGSSITLFYSEFNFLKDNAYLFRYINSSTDFTVNYGHPSRGSGSDRWTIKLKSYA